MRLKAQMWVSAYIKICAAHDLQAVVVRHGDDAAGAIFVRVNRLDGHSDLFAPAPAGMAEADNDRVWQSVFDGQRPDAEVSDYLEREAAIDDDLWVIEIESRSGTHHLEPWLTSD